VLNEMENHTYRDDLKDKARILRKNSTQSEKMLWRYLKVNRLMAMISIVKDRLVILSWISSAKSYYWPLK